MLLSTASPLKEENDFPSYQGIFTCIFNLDGCVFFDVGGRCNFIFLF